MEVDYVGEASEYIWTDKYHLRFTPHDLDYDKTFEVLREVFPTHLICWEDKDKDGNKVPLHYHMLLQSTMSLATIKLRIRTALKIPSAGVGKNNKYYALIPNWEKPQYILKYGNLLYNTMFSDIEIKGYVTMGREILNSRQQLSPVTQKKEKQATNEFEIFLEYFENKFIQPLNKPSLLAIKREMVASYIKRRKCLPPSGTITRMAYSIFLILRKCNTSELVYEHGETELEIADIRY